MTLGTDGYLTIIEHARRKLRQDYYADETPEPKAYGLLGARIAGDAAHVSHVFPLRSNARYRCPYRDVMDAVMDSVAVRSQTPVDRRGWVADSAELIAANRMIEQDDAVLLGSYHVHRVPWRHDPDRDTCTAVDEVLARGLGMWVFIVSMVRPCHPTIRAFFEGDNRLEARVLLPER